MLKGVENYHDFEKLVFQILSKTNPSKIDWYDGGRDRGKDFLVTYHHNDRLLTVLVECKYYSKRSVNIQDISKTLDWSKIYKPDLLYFWICPYLTPDTKDYLKLFEKEYHIQVDWEDSSNIEMYHNQLLSAQDSNIFTSLAQRIHHKLESSILNKGKLRFFDFELEYEAIIRESEHFLIDREQAQKDISSANQNTVYITGVSGSGKTQLAKHIIKNKHQEGKEIFWHTVLAENDPLSQLRSLVESLAWFFYQQFASNEFYKFVEESNSKYSIQLISIILMELKIHRVYIVLDNMHNCKSEHVFSIVHKIIIASNSNLLLLGWFNVLVLTPALQVKIKFIHLGGLGFDHLREIVSFYHKYVPSKTTIQKLINQYGGLPYYATLTSSDVANEFNSYIGEDYFSQLMQRLSKEEQEVLQILSIVRSKFDKSSFHTTNQKLALRSLIQKKLVSHSQYLCWTHDVLKKISFDFFQGHELRASSENAILLACKKDVAIIIDLIALYLNNSKPLRAQTLFFEWYNSLLNRGYDLALLQMCDSFLSIEACSFNEMILKKIIILERLGEYKLARELIGLIEDHFIEDQKNIQYFLYIKIRLLYFNSEYDDILQTCNTIIESNEDLNSHTYLQILFVLGRIYYVRGDYKPALVIYLVIFRATRGVDFDLMIKSLHRIAMIDEKCGFDYDALNTFNYILSFGERLSLKRRSFAYYRLAKSYAEIGDLEKALNLNEKSIELKTTLNHQRGLVFSYRLKSMIFTLKSDILNGLHWAERAYRLAHHIGSDKEIVSSGIALIDTIIKSERTEQLEKLISTIMPIIIKMKLSPKLKTINRTLENHDNLKIKNIEFQRSSQYSLHYNFFYEKLSQSDKVHINDFYSKNASLSRQLVESLTRI